jgi:hypothetical protein
MLYWVGLNIECHSASDFCTEYPSDLDRCWALAFCGTAAADAIKATGADARNLRLADEVLSPEEGVDKPDTSKP